LSVRGVLRESWILYRLFFWRSLLIAAPIFLVLDIPSSVIDVRPDTTVTVVLSSFALSLFTPFGDLLVEGFLAEDLREHYAGRPSLGIRELVRRIRPFFLILVGSTLVYSVGVAIGLWLLVVPGLFVLTRWSVIVPVIVLERRGVREAFRRCWQLVKGHSWKIFFVLSIISVASAIVEAFFDNLFFWLPEFYAHWIGTALVSTVTAPFAAHALSVIYYRLVDLQPTRSS
jgi:hypothetical protein